MRTKKHSKGPWWINGRYVYAGKCKPVAECPCGGVRHGKVDEANARLIAAAPELLAACREALDFCEGILARYYIQEMYNNLELAIAKAEGVPDDELQRRRAAVAKTEEDDDDDD